MTSWLDPQGRHEYRDLSGQSEFILRSILGVCLSSQGVAGEMPKRGRKSGIGSFFLNFSFCQPIFINQGNKEEQFWDKTVWGRTQWPHPDPGVWDPTWPKDKGSNGQLQVTGRRGGVGRVVLVCECVPEGVDSKAYVYVKATGDVASDLELMLRMNDLQVTHWQTLLPYLSCVKHNKIIIICTSCQKYWHIAQLCTPYPLTVPVPTVCLFLSPSLCVPPSVLSLLSSYLSCFHLSHLSLLPGWLSILLMSSMDSSKELSNTPYTAITFTGPKRRHKPQHPCGNVQEEREHE